MCLSSFHISIPTVYISCKCQRRIVKLAYNSINNEYTDNTAEIKYIILSIIYGNILPNEQT